MRMLTGLRRETGRYLQLSGGVFLTGVDHRACGDGGTLRQAVAAALDEGRTLGATLDGSFRCAPELLRREAAGRRAPTPGNTGVIRWHAELSGTMTELSPGNLHALLGGGTETGQGGLTRLTPGGAPGMTDGLCWVGDTGGGLAVIALDRAVNTGGLTLRFGGEREGRIPFTLEAWQRSDDGEMPPFAVLLLEENGEDEESAAE